MLRQTKIRRGAIIPLIALALITLFGMVALAIDLGLVALGRTQAQNAADVAALAAVRQLTGDASNNNNFAAVEPTAKSAAANNTVIGTAIDPNMVTAQVGYYYYNATAQRFDVNLSGTKPAGENWSAVQVDVSANRTAYFAKVFGASFLPIGASAQAVHRPRDIAVVLDFSGSMKYATDPSYPENGNITGSLNPDPAYPKFGHWSTMASVMRKTSAYVESDGDAHAPNNMTMETAEGPPIVKDFLYRDGSNILQNAFHRVAATYDAMTWACPAPSDWDTQLDTTQTYVGDKWPRWGKNNNNGYAETVQEYLLNSNNNATYTSPTHSKSATTGGGTGSFDPIDHNVPSTQEGYGPNFTGYSMGPGYYGKTFYAWPPDPRWHPSNTSLQCDWRKKFFFNGGTSTPLGGNSTSATADNRADNSLLWDTSGFWRPAGSTTYAVNYDAILSWITSGPQVLPPNLRAGRVLYYSAIPTTIPATGGTDDQKFWRAYIDYVIGAGSTTRQQQSLYGRHASAWGTMKITAKSALSSTQLTRPYMHYNDNPIRPRLNFWFGPLTMLCFLSDNVNTGGNRATGDYNWLPGTCHEAQCWQLKAGIQSALTDIKKNHPNDWASLIYFSGGSWLPGYNTARVPMGRDYDRMKNALFYPFSLLDSLGNNSAEIRPYDTNLATTCGGIVPNGNGYTAPEGGFKVAYNQFSTASGFAGRKGAAKVVIFETDGLPNTRCTGTLNSSGGAYKSYYSGLTYGSYVGNMDATVVSNTLDVVSQICALDTANPPGYSSVRIPARVHAIGFGYILESSSSAHDQALSFLLDVQKRGNTSPSSATSIESYKIITGDYNTRIEKLKFALERIMQTGVQVSLIR